MTTYHDGIAVPKTHVDYFTGIELDTDGEATVTLTYTPKSLNQILIAITNIRMMRVVRPLSLSGKNLTLQVRDLAYYKPDNHTATTDAAGGGATAEPHDHTVTTTLTGISLVKTPTILTDYDFAISYQVV